MPDIPVWNKCDNECVMCANGAAFTRNASRCYLLAGQVRRLERHLAGADVYRKNARTAGAWNLTGGEPALNPDFLGAIAYFRRRLEGEELLLLSNGRRFADPAFAAAFAAAARPPFRLGVSVHGPSAALHDRVAGAAGAFAQTMRGLKNLLGLPRRPELEIRVILHRLNFRQLGATLAMLRRELPGCRLVVMHYESEGRGARNAGKLAVGLSATAAAVNRRAALIEGFRLPALYHFPLCLLSPRLRPLARVSLPPEDRAYPAPCRGCTARAGCVGLMKPYLRRYGHGELKALA